MYFTNNLTKIQQLHRKVQGNSIVAQYAILAVCGGMGILILMLVYSFWGKKDKNAQVPVGSLILQNYMQNSVLVYWYIRICMKDICVTVYDK